MGRIRVIEEFLNRRADLLATQGAAMQAVPRQVRQAALGRGRLAVALQYTAVVVYQLRARSKPLEH
eukprot:2752512-Alexandrium_andersonii.AAC.1